MELNFISGLDMPFFYGLDFSGLGFWTGFAFVVCILCVVGFEFINGFHDTANAVATVIYTKTLKAPQAVLYSGILNFLGVIFGGIAVAIGIINLLPISELMAAPEFEKIALILAMLITAIIWNLGTWYYGIPCSSSHTLIGSILGVGIAFKYFNGGAGINWSKALETFYSLLISPIFGFSMAILLVYILMMGFGLKSIFKEPKKKSRPPHYIQAILISTCGLVSFFHGSNDGQKGVGLLLLVLIAFVPASFIVNPDIGDAEYKNTLKETKFILNKYATSSAKVQYAINEIDTLQAVKHLNRNSIPALVTVRTELNSVYKDVKKLSKDNEVITSIEDRKSLKQQTGILENYLSFAPLWVILTISISLGAGTMIGYKRIVKTIGEKIGKSHMTYGQGATSEIIAAITIGLSTRLGLPVSTTHVLSSAIAGSMVATGGIKNLQKGTIKNIAIAWVLTLPVTVLLSIILFTIFYYVLA